MGILLFLFALAAGRLATLAWRGSDRRTPAAVVTTAYESSDPVVREAARVLSSDPALAAGLSSNGLVRRFTLAVRDVADGAAPTTALAFLAPLQPFRVRRDAATTVIDPRSYARYDADAAMIASLDAAQCARVFRQLEPLLESCYRDLGHPQGGFRFALARAAAVLLAVPVVEGEVAVVPHVHMGVADAGLPESAALVYELADPRLEALSPAQKLLLRMGPRNEGLVQAKVAEIARAIDLPLEATRAAR